MQETDPQTLIDNMMGFLVAPAPGMRNATLHLAATDDWDAFLEQFTDFGKALMRSYASNLIEAAADCDRHAAELRRLHAAIMRVK